MLMQSLCNLLKSLTAHTDSTFRYIQHIQVEEEIEQCCCNKFNTCLLYFLLFLEAHRIIYISLYISLFFSHSMYTYRHKLDGFFCMNSETCVLYDHILFLST